MLVFIFQLAAVSAFVMALYFLKSLFSYGEDRLMASVASLLAAIVLLYAASYYDTGSLASGAVVLGRNNAYDVIAVEQSPDGWILCVGNFHEENYLDCDFESRLSRVEVEALLDD